MEDLHLKRGKHDLLQHARFSVTPENESRWLALMACGKSTLIEAILNHAPNTRLAPSARVGYFHQDMTELPAAKTVWQVMSAATALDGNRTRQVMGAFGLTARFYDRLVGNLSGGEQVAAIVSHPGQCQQLVDSGRTHELFRLTCLTGTGRLPDWLPWHRLVRGA